LTDKPEIRVRLDSVKIKVLKKTDNRVSKESSSFLKYIRNLATGGFISDVGGQKSSQEGEEEEKRARERLEEKDGSEGRKKAVRVGKYSGRYIIVLSIIQLKRNKTI